LVDLNTSEIKSSDWLWADIVMVSGMLSQRSSLLEITRQAKTLGKPVVAGGPYPTSLPQEMLDVGVDYVVRGEAENTVPLFLEALSQGRPGVFENAEYPDMSLSPVPRYDLLNVYDYLSLTIQTSRGCPFGCEFCDVINLFGRKPRYKTPDQVIAELETIHRLGWRGIVFVGDDNFIGSKKHAQAILEKLAPWNNERGQPFAFLTQASVNLGRDIELIDLMTSANFFCVFVGIESPDGEVLESSGKHQNVAHSVDESVSAINRNGLIILGSFIIGFDGERTGADARISAFVERTHVPIAMLNLLTAVPGTALWNRLEREGRLQQDVFTDVTMGGGCMNFAPSRPASDIYDEFINMWDHLYYPPRFFARTQRYFRNMRPTRVAMGAAEDYPSAARRDALPPLAIKLRNLMGGLRFLWSQGFRSRYRWDFWKQLVTLRRTNPSRVEMFLFACGFGENMFRLREKLLDQREKGLQEREASAASADRRRACGGGQVK
jgi:radical SAM superfamily enzyme YgiQ (UPF0313 family)